MNTMVFNQILLRAQSKLIKGIQINQRNGDYNDNSVRVEISKYVPSNPKPSKVDLSNVCLNDVESLLEEERNDDMIYFVAIPPKTNLTLSPFTRHLLLITSDSKIFLSNPLPSDMELIDLIDPPPIHDNMHSLANGCDLPVSKPSGTLNIVPSTEQQSVRKESVSTLSNPPFHGGICIHFQYYSDISKLLLQFFRPISHKFNHIPQLEKLQQQTLVIYMAKSRIPQSSAGSPESPNRQKRNSSKISKDIGKAVRSWSYFASNSNPEPPSKPPSRGMISRVSNDVDLLDNPMDQNDWITSDEIDETLMGGSQLDVDKTLPTIICLPFCVQFQSRSSLHRASISKAAVRSSSRRSSVDRKRSLTLSSAPPPPPAQASTPRLHTTLPKPHHPPPFQFVGHSSSPPLPPPTGHSDVLAADNASDDALLGLPLGSNERNIIAENDGDADTIDDDDLEIELNRLIADLDDENELDLLTRQVQCSLFIC